MEFWEERHAPDRSLLTAKKQQLVEHQQSLSAVHEILICHVQELFPIVRRIMRTRMNCSVRNSTSSASAIRLIRPGEADAVAQTFSAGSEAVITSWIATITAYLALLNTRR